MQISEPGRCQVDKDCETGQEWKKAKKGGEFSFDTSEQLCEVICKDSKGNKKKNDIFLRVVINP